MKNGNNKFNALNLPDFTTELTPYPTKDDGYISFIKYTLSDGSSKGTNTDRYKGKLSAEELPDFMKGLFYKPSEIKVLEIRHYKHETTITF